MSTGRVGMCWLAWWYRNCHIMCVRYPQLPEPAASCQAFPQFPFEEGNEWGIKSLNCTALAVLRKSWLSAREVFIARV